MPKMFVLRITKACPTTAATFLNEDPVPPGEIWEPRFVAVYNGSAESFKVEIGVLNSGVFTPFNVTAALATLTPVATDVIPLLGEGDTLAARATGSASGGNITLLATGWRRPLADPPAAHP